MKYFLLLGFVVGLSLVNVNPGNAADITGTWAFSLNLEGGPQNVPMTLVFKQDGEKLTGTQSGVAGEPKVVGSVKGNKILFTVEGTNRSGEPYKNSFTGTIESATSMTGTAVFPKGPGKWSATRK